MDEGRIILIAGALLAAGFLASLVAAWLRLPALLLFLVLGMGIGTDGTGWIDFSSYETARFIGIVALALILFEAGLAAGWREIRPVLRPAVGLAVVGTLVTAVVTGLIAVWLFKLPVLEGLLLGAVLSSTDGAAVFALLRSANLPQRLARTLEGEAGLNDPVAVLLVVGLIDLITKPSFGAADAALLFVEELGVGAAVGFSVGWLGVSAGVVRGPRLRAFTWSPQPPRWHWHSALPTSCGARASWPPISAVWYSGRRTCRPDARF